MWRVLRKTVKKDIKTNILSYVTAFILVGVGMYIAGMCAGTTYTNTVQTQNYYKYSNREDGEFITDVPLSDDELEAIGQEGYIIEDQRYYDVVDEGGNVFRVMKTRQIINIPVIDKGDGMADDGEMAINNAYCFSRNRDIGEIEAVGGAQLTISEVVSIPDYELPLKEMDDEEQDNSTFCQVFVTDATYDRILLFNEECEEQFVYAYVCPENKNNDDFEVYIKTLSDGKCNILQFVTSAQNKRMNRLAEDSKIYVVLGVLAGLAASLTAALILAVRMKSSLVSVQSNMGALLLEGFPASAIFAKYCVPTAVVATLAGLSGYLLSISMFGYKMLENNKKYYCVPYSGFNFSLIDNYWWVLPFCILIPAILTFVCVWLGLNCILRRDELELLKCTDEKTGFRGMKHKKHISVIGYDMYQLKNDLPFIATTAICSIFAGIIWNFGIESSSVIDYERLAVSDKHIEYGACLILGAALLLGYEFIVEKNRRQIAILKDMGYSCSKVTRVITMSATVVNVVIIMAGLIVGKMMCGVFWTGEGDLISADNPAAMLVYIIIGIMLTALGVVRSSVRIKKIN